MVKFYESNYSYDYSFPAVTLAYFLRYPNPYSKHVLATDVIDRHVDPDSGRLYTTRLHLKRSRLPTAVLKLLPQSVLNSVSGSGSSSSYILERSCIDIKEGWMTTESRNLDWTGILSVVERQTYHRELGDGSSDGNTQITTMRLPVKLNDALQTGTTNVATSVRFRSRIGERLRASVRKGSSDEAPKEEDEAPRRSLLSTWSTAGIQRSIELIASAKTVDQLLKSKEGMTIVLERLCRGGLVGVLDGRRRDRELTAAPAARLKAGANGAEPDH